MAALGRDAGGLHAGGAAAHDHDVARRLGGVGVEAAGQAAVLAHHVSHRVVAA